MMKKIFLLLCLALVTLVANAEKSPYDTKEKVINRAKAIVAQFVIAKKDGKFTKDPTVERPKDVDALSKLIENKNSKYDKICEEIKSKDFDAVDKSSLIEQFKKYLSERGIRGKPLDDASQQLEFAINPSDYPFTAKDGDDDNDDDDEVEDVDDGSKSKDNDEKSSTTQHQGTVKDKHGNDPTSEDDKGIRKTEIVSPILPIGILVLLLILLGLYCFQLWRNNKILQEEKKDVVKYLSQITPAYAKKSSSSLANAVLVKYKEVTDNNKTLENKIKDLKEEIENAERKSSAYNNSISTNRGNDYGNVSSNVVRGEESNSTTLTWDIDNSERSIHESESPKASLVGKEMFLYLPNDNMFKEGSEEYRSGKTLYKMVYTSEETADFEFVNRPEALAFAKQSRSRFLEGACFIENDDAISFNTIQTLEKGKLAKADEGWNIISKARIRLS